MMKNSFGISGLIFIGLASLVIFTHAILPHHHHFDSLFSHHEEEASDSCHQENHPEDKAEHCHAFNDLVVEKIRHSKTVTPIVKVLSDAMTINDFSFDFIENPIVKPEFIYSNKCLLNSCLNNNAPTRGSPAIV
jgi:hypothetical protein